MIVAELMTETAASVAPQAPLSEAARLMWDCDCGALPVVNDQGEVCGMITDRDICMATWSRNSAPASLTVASAMSNRLYFCLSTDTLSTAETLMRSKQIRRLPVLDAAGHLLGILSLADIAKGVSSSSMRSLMAADLSSTIAEICRPPLPPRALA